MMKKKYMTPVTKVVKIKFAGQLLAGSVDGNADIDDGGGSSENPNSLNVEFE